MALDIEKVSESGIELSKTYWLLYCNTICKMNNSTIARSSLDTNKIFRAFSWRYELGIAHTFSDIKSVGTRVGVVRSVSILYDAVSIDRHDTSTTFV